jgi:NAD-dependent SIR2 family protein deacetylase
MKCTKCNTDGKHVKFTSFEYWYCTKCKEEIPEKVMYAKKGDIITCPACNEELCELLMDAEKVYDISRHDSFKRLTAPLVGWTEPYDCSNEDKHNHVDASFVINNVSYVSARRVLSEQGYKPEYHFKKGGWR